MANGPFVPPGGFAGFAQQTPAAQAIIRGRNGQRKKRKRKTTTRKAKRRLSPSSSAGRTGATRGSVGRTRTTTPPARMVKGSAAAKRHMATLRNMRGKK